MVVRPVVIPRPERMCRATGIEADRQRASTARLHLVRDGDALTGVPKEAFEPHRRKQRIDN